MGSQKRMQQPKTYEERIDPGGETGQLAAGLTTLASSRLARPVLRWLGIDEETLDAGSGAKRTYDELVAAPAEVVQHLTPRGWAFFGDSPLDDHRTAAQLVAGGQVDDADELLTEVWNEGNLLLRPAQRMFGLYWGDAEREQIGRERSRLLREALDLHREGHYAGAIPIVLAQIDGLFLDATGKTAKNFFIRNNSHVLDDETLAGHPDGLRVIATLMAQSVTTTGADGKLTRHGITHGRELAYDTRVNSTKAFVALLAVIEWAKPKLDAQSRAAAAAKEARYAGSKELDEEGRRLDQRGFDEGKQALLKLASYQYGHFKRHGRYAASQQQLDPAGDSFGDLSVEIATATANEYWAWIVTPTGFIFGVAGRDGEHAGWQYGSEEPPGPIDSDTDWRHVARDPSAPEW